MYQAFFDGSSKGNPGPSQIAYVITDETKKVIVQDVQAIGETTNNVAEYKSLILLLGKLCTEKFFPVSIQGDSKLVIEQMVGDWKVKAPHLKVLAEETHKLLKELPDGEWTLKWIRRDFNIADRLAQKGY
jgi:ribonuclease HI